MRATREKLPGVGMAFIVIVLLPMIGSSTENETLHRDSLRPMYLTKWTVTTHGGHMIGTVGVRVTVVGGSVSLMRIMPSIIFTYIHHIDIQKSDFHVTVFLSQLV